MKDEHMDRLEVLQKLLDIAKQIKEAEKNAEPSDEEIEKIKKEKIEKFPFLKEFDDFSKWSMGEKLKKISSADEFVLTFAKHHPDLPLLEYDEEMSDFENQIVLIFQAAKHYFNKKT